MGLLRLAQDLRVKPSAETVALAEQIRVRAAASRGSTPARPEARESGPPSELVAPLVGRAAAFRQLVGNFQQARRGQPQAVLVVGEAGIGKTRLTSEWLAWVRAQGADIMRGHVVEMGGRLPYQPLVEALRERLEVENAPEDLLEDVWLAELSRLLPELRVRYPDLPDPNEDELTARGQLFEAVARLFDALARRAPLVLLLEDLHWLDGASLDLLRYLGHSWKEHSSRVLLLGTLRSEGLELNPQLSTQLTNLGRDLPLGQVPLQPLSQQETLQLLEAITGEHGTRNEGEQDELSSARPSTAEPRASLAPTLVALGDFLFARTGGQPLYLLETLKLLRDRQWLVPRLGTSASAPLLWQLAELEVRAGIEVLEEAVRSGILHEEVTGRGRAGSFASLMS
jgi:predicted ATPase